MCMIYVHTCHTRIGITAHIEKVWERNDFFAGNNSVWNAMNTTLISGLDFQLENMIDLNYFDWLSIQELLIACQH